MFEAGQYFNQDTGRYVWAVFCKPSRTWVFCTRPGRVAAQRLARKLNESL